MCFVYFKNWANPLPLFLLIFVLFHQHFAKNTVGFSVIRTQIVRLEGE